MQCYLDFVGCLCPSVRGWIVRQHSGDLRCSEVLQDADGDKHLHSHAGSGRRVLPRRHTISHRYLRYVADNTKCLKS